ncbi:MAG: ABC transporter ATP-binding protein [Planctomycetota bacterium]|jgi:ABC-2 type transport system ATP-binding protein
MIEARRLTRTFGRHLAVAGIDFRLEAGGVYGFLGPNGAGKTTTIRMITACIPPTAGDLTLDGIDVVRRPLEARRRIGYLPESTPLDPAVRVRDYLRFRADLAGVPRRRRRAAIDRSIEDCDLQTVRGKIIATLSKGFRQRVGLAAAILHEPPVLVLDEPTVGLDPRQIVEVRRLIRRLAGRHTVILSTHILPEAESICDSVLLFAGGRIRARGRLSELQAGGPEGGVGWIVSLPADAGGADPQPVLAAIPGVADVQRLSLAGEEAGRRPRRFRVLARPAEADGPPPELGPAIAAAMATAGVPLLELSRERTTLEQRFIEIVTAAAEDDRRRGFDRDAGDAGGAGDVDAAGEAAA